MGVGREYGVARQAARDEALDLGLIDSGGTPTGDSTALKIAQDLADLNSATTARTNLGLGTAAVLDHGTANGNLVRLDATGLPAVDGSQLTNLPGGGGTVQGTDGTYDIQPANEGATAGNARGEYSVDLSTHRASANQVASGADSVIAGGRNNRASGSFNATVGGGFTNTASADSSTVSGGTTNTASGTAATVGGGNTCAASSTNATVAGGSSNTASSTGASVGGGQSNTASGAVSTVPGGSNAVASHYGEFAHATSANLASGDLQRSVIQFNKQTTDANQTEMTLASSSRFTLSNDDIYHATIKVFAVNTANGSHACWTFFNVSAYKNGANNVAVNNGGTSIGPDTNVNNGTDMSVCLVDVDADTSNQALRIQVTGIASTTINWFAYADCGKVNY